MGIFGAERYETGILRCRASGCFTSSEGRYIVAEIGRLVGVLGWNRDPYFAIIARRAGMQRENCITADIRRNSLFR